MASYHLSVHPNVSRGKGQSLARTAAYNARARLTDERTGKVWDYRRYGPVLFEGIYAAKAPDWARELGQLVNGIELAEKRADAQLAMNIDIGLPHELTLEQNHRLIQDFVREQFMRPGYAAHVAIHAPDLQGDPRNIHAHVLVSLRKIGLDGFASTKPEQQERYRSRGAFVEQLRQKWEQLANRHLARHDIDARIDRRSLDEQGSKRKPEKHRGPVVTAMQRRSQVKHIGSKIPESMQHQAAHAAEVPPAAPEEVAPVFVPDPPKDPAYAPDRDDSVEILPAPLPSVAPAVATPAPEPAPQFFVGKNSYAIDGAPIVTPRAIGDENPDDSPGVTGEIVSEAEPQSPPRTLGGAIKGLFRAAVKTLLRRDDVPRPETRRRRRGDTTGEFRRLARRCSRRYDARADFKGRASILSRSFSIPVEVYSMAAAHLSELINGMNNDDSNFDNGFDATGEYISPQP